MTMIKPRDYTGQHRATDPEPYCTCGAGMLCNLREHETYCAMMLDLYKRHVLAPPEGICGQCGLVDPTSTLTRVGRSNTCQGH